MRTVIGARTAASAVLVAFIVSCLTIVTWSRIPAVAAVGVSSKAPLWQVHEQGLGASKKGGGTGAATSAQQRGAAEHSSLRPGVHVGAVHEIEKRIKALQEKLLQYAQAGERSLSTIANSAMTEVKAEAMRVLHPQRSSPKVHDSGPRALKAPSPGTAGSPSPAQPSPGPSGQTSTPSPSSSSSPSPSGSGSGSSSVSDGSLWWVGTILYITGATFISLGINMQKFSMNEEEKKPVVDRREAYSQPIWFVGFVLYQSAAFLLSLALEFAAESQLSPLIIFILLSNCVFAHYLLHEPFSRQDGIAVGVIMVGLLLTTGYAPHTTKNYTEGELIQLYWSIPFFVFIFVLGAAMVYLYRNNDKLETERKHCEMCGRNLPARKMQMLWLTYGGLAGCFGGFLVTLMKSALTLIVGEFNRGWANSGDACCGRYVIGGLFFVLKTPLLWVVIVVLVFCWANQLKWITSGLECGPAMIIVSAESITSEIIATCGGILYFHEYTEFPGWNGPLFLLGILLGIGGVVMLTSARMQSDPELDKHLSRRGSANPNGGSNGVAEYDNINGANRNSNSNGGGGYKRDSEAEETSLLAAGKRDARGGGSFDDALEIGLSSSSSSSSSLPFNGGGDEDMFYEDRVGGRRGGGRKGSSNSAMETEDGEGGTKQFDNSLRGDDADGFDDFLPAGPFAASLVREEKVFS